MAVTDEARYLLYQRLEIQLGHEEATILMDHLPYGGWANLATKQDIVRIYEHIDVESKVLRNEMVTGFAKIDVRFSEMDTSFEKVGGQLAAMSERIDKALAEGMAEIHKGQWRFVMAMLTLLVAVGAVVAGLSVT